MGRSSPIPQLLFCRREEEVTLPPSRVVLPRDSVSDRFSVAAKSKLDHESWCQDSGCFWALDLPCKGYIALFVMHGLGYLLKGRGWQCPWVGRFDCLFYEGLFANACVAQFHHMGRSSPIPQKVKKGGRRRLPCLRTGWYSPETLSLIGSQLQLICGQTSGTRLAESPKCLYLTKTLKI